MWPLTKAGVSTPPVASIVRPATTSRSSSALPTCVIRPPSTTTVASAITRRRASTVIAYCARSILSDGASTLNLFLRGVCHARKERTLCAPPHLDSAPPVERRLRGAHQVERDTGLHQRRTGALDAISVTTVAGCSVEPSQARASRACPTNAAHLVHENHARIARRRDVLHRARSDGRRRHQPVLPSMLHHRPQLLVLLDHPPSNPEIRR